MLREGAPSPATVPRVTGVVDPQVLVPVNPQVPHNVVVPPVNVQVSSQALVAMTSANINPQVNVTVHPQLNRLNANSGSLNINLNKLSDTIRYRNRQYNRTFKAIVQELVKMKIITDTNHVSLNLNEKELIVNGVKQHDDVYKLIFEKYGKNNAGYGYQTNYPAGNQTYSYSNSKGYGS